MFNYFKKRRRIKHEQRQKYLDHLNHDHVYLKEDGNMIASVLLWSPQASERVSDRGDLRPCLVIKRNSWEISYREFWWPEVWYSKELPAFYAELFGQTLPSALDLLEIKHQLPSQDIQAPRDKAPLEYKSQIKTIQRLKTECDRLEFEISEDSLGIFERIEAEYLRTNGEFPEEDFRERLELAKGRLTQTKQLLNAFDSID